MNEGKEENEEENVDIEDDEGTGLEEKKHLKISISKFESKFLREMKAKYMKNKEYDFTYLD